MSTSRRSRNRLGRIIERAPAVSAACPAGSRCSRARPLSGGGRARLLLEGQAGGRWGIAAACRGLRALRLQMLSHGRWGGSRQNAARRWWSRAPGVQRADERVGVVGGNLAWSEFMWFG